MTTLQQRMEQLPKYDQQIGYAIWLEKPGEFHRDFTREGAPQSIIVFDTMEAAIVEATEAGWLDSAYHLIPLRAGQHQRRPFYVASQWTGGNYYAAARANTRAEAERVSAEMLAELLKQWKADGNELADAVFSLECQEVTALR